MSSVLQTSSPIPVVKSERKSIKAALRKKDGMLVRPNKSAIDPSRKRARERDHDAEHEAQDTLSLSRPVKRVKSTNNAAEEGIQPETTESQVLKPRTTAAVRSTKRYRTKKGRTSSPLESNPERTDYDQIPQSPPSSATDSNIKVSKLSLLSVKNEPPSSGRQSSVIARRTRGAKAAKAKQIAEKISTKGTAARREEQHESADSSEIMQRSIATTEAPEVKEPSNTVSTAKVVADMVSVIQNSDLISGMMDILYLGPQIRRPGYACPHRFHRPPGQDSRI